VGFAANTGGYLPSRIDRSRRLRHPALPIEDIEVSTARIAALEHSMRDL
jgi:hypothetical protein